MKIKTYEDGSVYTEKHLAVSVAGGLALMGVFFGTKAAVNSAKNWNHNRKVRKAERGDYK